MLRGRNIKLTDVRSIRKKDAVCFRCKNSFEFDHEKIISKRNSSGSKTKYYHEKCWEGMYY